MRGALAVWFCGLLLFGAGCGRGPLITGKAEGGTIWKNPTSAATNEGSQIEKGSRVEVYERFIVVTDLAGRSQLAPDTNYSGLIFKKE
jgi:hypothetical protein